MLARTVSDEPESLPPREDPDAQPMSMMLNSPDAILSELHYSSSSEASTSATTSSGTTVRHLERELDQVRKHF